MSTMAPSHIEIMRAALYFSDSEDENELPRVFLPEWDGKSIQPLLTYGNVRRPSTMSWFDWQELLESIPGTPEYVEGRLIVPLTTYKTVESKKQRRERLRKTKKEKQKYPKNGFSFSRLGGHHQGPGEHPSTRWKRNF